MAFINHTKGASKGALKVFIATPTYSGKLDNRFVHALIESLSLFEKENIGYEFFTLSYHCHVDDARNEIVAKFRESDCDALIFLDADVAWAPDALVNLAKHDRDVVAGVYPKRALNDLDFPVLVEPGVTLQADEMGLVEVSGAPTGFMKIKRHVIEKMADANSHRTFLRRGSASVTIATAIIFERTYEDGQRFSGDYSFCRAWRKMGGKVFVDPEMRLTHTGEIEFSGTLGDHWREKHGVAQSIREERFRLAIEDLRAGNPKEESFNDLVQGWNNPDSAQADLLAVCYYTAKSLKEKDGAILEAGCGLSTLVMALANPEIKIHALEHDPVWVSAINHAIEAHNIKNVTVHFGRLKDYEGGKWYDTATLPKENFSIALCDGPPRTISNRNIFWQKIGEQIKNATVFLDDADDIRAVLPMKLWAKNNGREVKVLGAKRKFAVCNKAV